MFDNWIIRNDLLELEEWSKAASRQGRGGWNRKGLVLIDFGHCIDQSLYPPGTLFQGKCSSDTFVCADMRAEHP